jgi:hypothetical protein
MFHVCQRGFMDCGVAVAAMLTGVTYEEVLDRWFGCMNVENGLREIALKRILEDITEIEWRISELGKPWPQLSTYSFRIGRLRWLSRASVTFDITLP